MPRSTVLLVCVLVGCGTCLAGVAASALESTATAPQPWPCFMAPDAVERRARVEQGLLPRVVFEGRDQPASVPQRMTQHKVPALSVAVIRQGRLDWTAAYGRLGLDDEVATCDSLFQAGSIAKPVTLLAVLRMHEQGIVDLDRDVERYLQSFHLPPGRQTPSNPVTLRNLLAHTSGITPGGYRGYAAGELIPTDQQVVSGAAPANSRRVEVLQPPGEALQYSGGAYTVVEIALQDLQRKPFEQILREWVLDPAGMRQADFTQPLPQASASRAARGFDAQGRPVPGGWHTHPEQAAAGLWATPTDLGMFLIELWNGTQGRSRVFGRASLEEMLRNPIEGHAYGFVLVGEGERLFITHYGGTVGYTAGMTMNLATGNGAVFMTNAQGATGFGLEFLQSVSRTYDWPVFRETRVTAVDRPQHVLQTLTGRYRFGEDGPQVAVSLESGALALLFANGDRYALVPISDGPLEFIHPATGVRVGFEAAASESRMRLYGEVGVRVRENPAPE